MRPIAFATLLLLLVPGNAQAAFTVPLGSSWDNVPLQQLIDDYLGDLFPSYSPGDVDVLTMYEGYLPGDADLSPAPYWSGSELSSFVVQEIAGYRDRNTMGWYQIGVPEGAGNPSQIVVDGALGPGDGSAISLPASIDFGFWLDPNGSEASNGAPQGEYFYTARALNDAGPDGSGTLHGPEGGDPQCLIFNVSELFGGPAYILAWEDLDSGLEISPVYGTNVTDNDYNDLVVVIFAFSVVPTEESSWGRVKALYGAR
jgi:hypothetical protein